MFGTGPLVCINKIETTCQLSGIDHKSPGILKAREGATERNASCSLLTVGVDAIEAFATMLLVRETKLLSNDARYGGDKAQVFDGRGVRPTMCGTLPCVGHGHVPEDGHESPAMKATIDKNCKGRQPISPLYFHFFSALPSPTANKQLRTHIRIFSPRITWRILPTSKF